MKNSLSGAITVLMSAALLGGCQGLFSHRAKLDVRPIPFPETSGYGAIQLTLGRKALDDQRYAEAITAFRVARLDPGLAPEALNGLAIAYAGLGRTDLSERYFNDAIALAPTDDRFRANLARLYRTKLVPQNGVAAEQALALAKQQASTIAPAQPVAVAAEQTRGPITVTRPATRVIRISLDEVRIGPAPTAAAPAVGSAKAQAAVTVQKSGTLASNSAIRVGMTGGAAARSANYPLRVEISSSR